MAIVCSAKLQPKVSIYANLRERLSLIKNRYVGI
jgi:hypothetical protein